MRMIRFQPLAGYRCFDQCLKLLDMETTRALNGCMLHSNFTLSLLRPYLLAFTIIGLLLGSFILGKRQSIDSQKVATSSKPISSIVRPIRVKAFFTQPEALPPMRTVGDSRFQFSFPASFGTESRPALGVVFVPNLVQVEYVDSQSTSPGRCDSNTFDLGTMRGIALNYDASGFQPDPGGSGEKSWKSSYVCNEAGHEVFNITYNMRFEQEALLAISSLTILGSPWNSKVELPTFETIVK